MHENNIIEGASKTESRELGKEKVKLFLDSIKQFSQDGYDDCLSHIDGLVQKVESKESLTADDKFELDAIIDKILSVSVLNADNICELEKDRLMSAFLRPDIRNVLDGVSLALDGCNKTRPDNIKVKSCAIVLKKWPIFSLILEDILLRAVPSDELQNFSREFNPEHFGGAIYSFAHELSAAEKKHYDQKLIVPEFLKAIPNKKLATPVILPGLRGDEVLVGSPGLVLNSLFNILRNSRDEEIKSKRFKLDIDIEDGKDGRDMVFRVLDDGTDIKPDCLKHNNADYIFQVGTNHKDNTGCGLADMPQRLRIFGDSLTVISKPKAEQGTGLAEFSNNESSPYLENLKQKYFDGENIVDQNKQTWSTIFEIRLPIKKKS